MRITYNTDLKPLPRERNFIPKKDRRPVMPMRIARSYHFPIRLEVEEFKIPNFIKSAPPRILAIWKSIRTIDESKIVI